MTEMNRTERLDASSDALTDEAADALFAKLKALPALVESNDEIYELERMLVDEGIFRRILFSTMKFSGAELVEMANRSESAKTLALAEAAGLHWAKRTREMIDLVETQAARLTLALCSREDMEAIRSSAKAELFSAH